MVPNNMFLSLKVIAQYRDSFLLMFSLTLFIKFLASSMVLLTCLSRYLFISLSERKVKISCSSVISSCLRVSLSVVKIGKGVKLLFNILAYLVCQGLRHHSLTAKRSGLSAVLIFRVPSAEA